jgi:hypothetical protein
MMDLLQRACVTLISTASLLGMASHSVATELQPIKCTLIQDGVPYSEPTTYFVDEDNKRLLDSERQPYGVPDQWDKQSIRIRIKYLTPGMTRTGGMVFKLDRVTGAYQLYDEDWASESMPEGRCEPAGKQ